MITELEFHRALNTVNRFKNQTNDAYYEAVVGVKKNQTCGAWAKYHPNMSQRLRTVLMYNCPKVKVLNVTKQIRKITRGFGPKAWMEFCKLTGKNTY